jgi:hypothetical protein
MRCHETLVITDVSEKCIASIMRATKIGELGTTLAVTSNRSTLVTANVVPSSPILVILIMAIRSSEMSVLRRATRRHIPWRPQLLHISSFNLPRHSSRIVALWIFSRGEEWLAREADSLTVMCEPNIYRMRDPRCPLILWTSRPVTGMDLFALNYFTLLYFTLLYFTLLYFTLLISCYTFCFRFYLICNQRICTFWSGIANVRL